MFVHNDHASACNGWAYWGLHIMSEMAAAAGSTANASLYASQSESIKAAMVKLMWDPNASRYCDGACTDPAVNGHGGVTTDYFTSYFGLVPANAVQHVWDAMVTFGLTQIGDYGAFIFLSALAMHSGDDGTAMVTALTKCDAYSWCNEIQTYNATMTMEALGHLSATMSHGWGVAPIVGVVNGVMGIAQTAPAWSTFTVKPRLAKLQFANITVPTLRGPIVVTATPTTLSVAVPCNTQATLCLPAIRRENGAFNIDGGDLLLVDGNVVESVWVAGGSSTVKHLCAAQPVGCRANRRVLATNPKQ